MKKYLSRLTTILMASLLVAVLVLPLSGCKKAEDKMDQAVYGALDKVQSVNENNSRSYQEVRDDYSEKLANKGAELAKELTKEAPDRYKADGNTLTKLLRDKTQALNELYQEGLKELSEAMLLSGDTEGAYDTEKDSLYSAYSKAESVIMDAYTEALSNVQ